MREITRSVFAKNKLANAKKVCCEFWKVDSDTVFDKNRERIRMNAKHSIRYMLSLDRGLTLAQIGGLTNCDHSNVVHSKSTFLNMVDVDGDFAAMNRVILGAAAVNKKEALRSNISSIIFSEMIPTKQVDLIYELIKTTEAYENR
jgi:hypothetical protein|tara:strand:- start:999 stop:1433 length:435 start_codon:yes stop_codon:yes gene_type:complete